MCINVCVHARAFIVLQYLVSSPGGGLTLPLRELLVSWGDDRTNFSTEDPGHTFHIGLDANMGLPFVLYCRVWALTGGKTNRYEKRRMYVDTYEKRGIYMNGDFEKETYMLFHKGLTESCTHLRRQVRRRIDMKRDVYM